ncbi:MAG: hypothetical protein O2820_18105 [Planctomycetota bacterium]|nr:hypothetical protein [Planctomycetota bacterium]MDA1251134.1 hypothetical protein [Planctomycetota bacterium]
MLSRLTRFLSGLLAASIVCGCGSQAYEERLEQSRKYFEYRQGVDAVLQPRWWQADGFGLQFRPPADFVEIPGPAEGEPDHRQPGFLPRPLRGLIGAWEATVDVDIEGSDVAEQRAWIFLCTNHEAFLRKEDDPLVEPEKFTDQMIGDIGFCLRYAAPTAEEPWPFVEERTPAGTRYVPVKDYIVTNPTLDDRVNIDGSGEVNMSFMLNQYTVDSIQMMLIVAYPTAIDTRYGIENRIRTVMETLRMTNEIPSKKKMKVPTSGGGF